MAITPRTAIETLNAAAATSYTVNKPVNLADNDYVVLSFELNGGTFTSPPTGFALIKNELTQANPKLLVYGKQIGTVAGEGTWTVTHSAVNSTTLAEGYGGVDATTALDAAALSGTGGTGSNTMTVASITTVTDGALLVYIHGANSSSNALSPPAGMTEAAETSATKKQAIDHQTITPAGATGTRAGAAVSNTLAWAAIMFPLRPATVAASDPVPRFQKVFTSYPFRAVQ